MGGLCASIHIHSCVWTFTLSHPRAQKFHLSPFLHYAIYSRTKSLAHRKPNISFGQHSGTEARMAFPKGDRSPTCSENPGLQHSSSWAALCPFTRSDSVEVRTANPCSMRMCSLGFSLQSSPSLEGGHCFHSAVEWVLPAHAFAAETPWHANGEAGAWHSWPCSITSNLSELIFNLVILGAGALPNHLQWFSSTGSPGGYFVFKSLSPASHNKALS